MKRIIPDKTGEEIINTFGSKCKIINYRQRRDMDVLFEEYNWIYYNAEYGQFEKGNIKCPYEKRTVGKGYFGEGKYVSRSKIDGKITKQYQAWHGMLRRCYDKKYHERHPSYIGCTVCEEWLNFQVFSKWYDENYYEIEGQIIDKDILIRNNKIYSPTTCTFAPQCINKLFCRRQNDRGNYLIGTYPEAYSGKFRASYMDPFTKKRADIGFCKDEKSAFLAYKVCKERIIKEVADFYKYIIPETLYLAMYKYKVEITD